MNDFQAVADRVEIEALRGEFTDAVMMNDHDRLASLFTPDGAVRIPLGNIEAVGREQIRALGERRQALTDYFLLAGHPGTIRLDGDTASGRAYLSELAHGRDGSSHLNYFTYHDRYQRTGDGWKFTERAAEFRYLDTTPLTGSAPPFAGPAPAGHLERAAAALTANGFIVEILDDATAARARLKELIPEGASVFTGASETLRLSGIEEDINASGRYDSIRARCQAMDRATQMDEIRRTLASPDVAVGSVAAVTETGSLVVASASGSQLPGYAGGAAQAIWIVGAQKVVPDLPAALRRVEDHCLPLESARAQEAYGRPSAINRLLILNAEPHPGRGTVLLLREAIGF